MNYDFFISEWLDRAERREGDPIDMGDKFISLWISFDAWSKSEFGEDKSDKVLIKKVIGSSLKDTFDLMSEEEEYKRWLTTAGEWSVMDLRGIEDDKNYDGSFESLILFLYQIRSNLFHARKNYEDNERDKELVELGYNLLYRLFKKHIEVIS